MTTRQVGAGLGVWLAIAIGVGAAGVLSAGPVRLPQGILVGLTVLTLAIAPLRRWAMKVDIRALVAFHLSRFVGAYFLYLYSRGELPYDFAVKGGIGDILVALAALLVICKPARTGLIAWNLFGLCDILFVVATAARLAGSMHALTVLPLSLLPTWLVPLIIATHTWMLVRLFKGRP